MKNTKKNIILSSLLFILINGCSWFSYHNFKHQGISIYDRQFDTDMKYDQMKTIIDYSLNLLGHNELFKKYNIVFTSAWLGQPRFDGKTNIADGLTDINNKVIYIKVRKCIWDTALIHEMAHVIQYEVSNIYDVNHEDFIFWNKIDKLENEVVKLCPEGYIKTERIR